MTKKLNMRISLVLVLCLLVGMIPFGAFAAGQEVSITGISGYNFRGNDWFIILDTDIADFELTAVSGLQAPMDQTTAQVWFQSNSAVKVAAGKVSFTLAADKAEHTVTIPAGTALGQYALKQDFVLCTHADGSVTVGEVAEPPVDDASALWITGIAAYNFRGSDWYIILETNIANFELTAVSGLQASMDDTTAQVWFQVNSQLSVPAGRLAFTLAADKAEHIVTIPAGLELGGYTLKEDLVLYTHANGSVTADVQTAPPVEEVSVFQISDIAQYMYRPNNNDWYIIVNTDIADFAVTAISGLKAPMDDTTAQVWYQVNSQLGVPAGSFAFTLAADKAEHTVTISAGTELGGYTLKEDFVFRIHADGTAEIAPRELTITGVREYNCRANDWYIILDTNIADFELTSVSGLQAPMDDTTAQVWFQVNSQLSVPAGSFAFTLAADKGEHTVTIPAGTELGDYIVKADFTFYTHSSGAVDTVPPMDLAGWSMTLGDNLDMNFFVSIAEADVANTSVQISVGDEISLLYPQTPDSETGYYKFSVELAAAQMTETVTYTLLLGESVIESNTYTVRQYADTILEGQYDEATKNLVRAMLHYGAAAQTYFGYMTESLANAQLDTPVYTAIPEQAETPMSVNGNVTGISFYGASLLFRSKTAVRFYFAASAVSGCTFTANGKNYTPVKAEDGMYYVEIDGINPQELSESITLTVKNGAETLTVVYGPMNYIVRMGASGSAKLKDLLLAMYNYHLAAKAL